MDKSLEREKRDWYVSPVVDISLAVLLPAAIMVITESLARGSVGSTAEWVVSNPLMAEVNYMLWFTPINLLQFLKKRCWVWTYQFALTSAFVCIAIGNSIKLEFRSAPLIFDDISVLKDAFSMAKEYLPKLNIPFVLIGALFLIVAFAVIMVKRFRHYAAGKYRLILFGLELVFIVLVPLMQSAFWAEANTVKNTFENNGFAAGFVNSAVQTLNSGKRPANYNDSEVGKIVNSIQSEDEANADSDTNIIVILGEAVMDTDMLSGVGFTADPIPTIHQVMHEFSSGYVTVETQGGGTYSAESQVLTGLREVNYTKLAASNRYLPSLATVLEQYGYQTHALHSYFGWFYDRYDIMRLLGFNEFICQTNFVKPLTVYGTWPQDSCLYEEAMDVMTESEGTDFCYLVTMETHGDYKYEMEDKNWFTNELDHQSASQLNTYLSVLNDADTALGDFLNRLAAWDEPTVVVYFGDHIPSLGAETYSAVDFDTTTPESFMTPYFIWSNCGIEDDGGNMPVERLGAHVLSILGFDSEPFFTITEDALSDPAFDEKDDERSLLNYDILNGDQYYLPLTNTDLTNEGYRIGHEITIRTATWMQIYNNEYIEGDGTNVNENCELLIDGKSYPLSCSGTTWNAVIPDAAISEDEDTKIEIVMKDNQGTIISRSNPASITENREAAEEIVHQAEESLQIQSIYPGTEITSDMLKQDGCLDIGITSVFITEDTVICANGTDLMTYYGDSFISATIPAEMIASGQVEVYLYNRVINKKSDVITISFTK